MFGAILELGNRWIIEHPNINQNQYLIRPIHYQGVALGLGAAAFGNHAGKAFQCMNAAGIGLGKRVFVG